MSNSDAISDEGSTIYESFEQYVNSLKEGYHRIAEKFRTYLITAVIEDVAYYFFGHTNNDGVQVAPTGDVRMTKITQNIEMMTTGLLGMEVHRDDMLELRNLYKEKLLESVVARGAAAGVEAGQSLVQPIIQAMLKTQHKTGNKQAIAGANSIEDLNKLKTRTNVIRVHLRNNGVFGSVVIDHRYLSDRYEQIRMHDVLVSSMGNSKVEEGHFDPMIYKRTDVVFINQEADKAHRPKQPVYQFQVDPDKLGDAGITMIHILQTLMLIKNVCFVVYPLSTFRFDMINIDLSKVTDARALSQLEKMTIKGIDGLAHINTREIEAKDVIKLHKFVDDDGKPKTRAYLDMYYYTQVPLDEIRRMVVTEESSVMHEKLRDAVTRAEKEEDLFRKTLMDGSTLSDQRTVENLIAAQEKASKARDALDEFKHTVATPSDKSLGLERVDTLFYLEYDGDVRLSKQPYLYYLFHGDITISDINKLLGKYMNHDYTTTNDPREMIGIYGRSVAMTQHELLYSEELESTDTDMLYQHISLICAYMFAFQLNPTTPSGYLKNKGVTALDRFAFEQYAENLGVEAVRGTISDTKSITTSIFTGNKADVGTAYIKFRTNQERRKQVMESYKTAYEEQLYEGKHQGITLPVFDKIEMRSKLRSAAGELLNNINPFE